MLNAKPTSAAPDNIKAGKIILEKTEAQIKPNITLMNLDNIYYWLFIYKHSPHLSTARSRR